MKKLLHNCYQILNNIIHFIRTNKEQKIFCISMQRNGTTSVGRFLEDHGIRVQHHGRISRRWSQYWLKGDYDKIFNSIYFRSYQAHEDNPWWYTDFYKVLENRFPNAKFILFYRDPNKWFKSMMNHSNGRSPGNTYIHCKNYGRLHEYYKMARNNPKFDFAINKIDNLLTLKGYQKHYINVYNKYNQDAKRYFTGCVSGKLFICRLEDEEKWSKLGKFLGIKIAEEYNVHLNKSLMNSAI